MIQINGANWDIYLVSPNHPMLLRQDGTFTLGCCDNNFKTIYIVNNLGPLKLWDVVVHEISHAYLFSYGYILDCYCDEELVVDFIAKRGLEIIQTSNFVFNEIKGSSF